jgi:hypothetical protein
MEDIPLKDDLVEEDGLYTEDGTLDIHKKPANKKTTGNWKACRFILGIKFLTFLYVFHKLQCHVLEFDHTDMLR